MMVFDSDDFGANHEISDQCQSHDCRDVLLKLKEANPAFKATLFAIPDEMTIELLEWSKDNKDWIELAQHGFAHTSNYECEKMTYDEFDELMEDHEARVEVLGYFVKGFKAPGWQISDGVYDWLNTNSFWVADQSYNNERRPDSLKAYVNENGRFGTILREDTDSGKNIPYFHQVNGVHTHTWNCVGNGVYELFDELLAKVKAETEFKFVSEVL